MRFSTLYSELVASLPPELRGSVIEYGQLKKLIGQVVDELTSLGLSPQVLQPFFEQVPPPESLTTPHPAFSLSSGKSAASSNGHLSKVTYELKAELDNIQPLLRVWTYDETLSCSPSVWNSSPENALSLSSPDTLETKVIIRGDGPTISTASSSSEPREVIIPLPSDSTFIQTLLRGHRSLTSRLSSFRKEFYASMEELSHDISQSALPMSRTHKSFHAYSSLSDPAFVNVRSPRIRLPFSPSAKSDLYPWREVMQLYTDAAVFESLREDGTKRERGIVDAEKRLKTFVKTLEGRGLLSSTSSTGRRMKLRQSKRAIQTFVRLNASILDLFKLQFATNEAIRRILNKHTKRTSLKLPLTDSFFPSPFLVSPLPLSTSPPPPSPPNGSPSPTPPHHVSSSSAVSLARSLLGAFTETVLSTVPAVNDYNCAICLNIAFKPIRLGCGHLFCVRCLVKMQKRSQDKCPICRTPCVLAANRANVDWALLNFMTDWFPLESRKKTNSNEKEAAREELAEFGLTVGCNFSW